MSEIDENSLNQAIYEYTWEKHHEILERYMDEWEDEFPEKDLELPSEIWHNNFFAWMMFEKEIPGTGKTLAELFAEDTPGLSDEMRDNLLRMRDVIRSKFIVIKRKGRFLDLKDADTKKIYRVKMHEEFSISTNTVIYGGIQPFGDRYRFTGVFRISTHPLLPDPDVLLGVYENARLEELEDITLRKGTSLRTVLNKYPADWIDHICGHYGLKARRKKEKAEKIMDKVVDDLPQIVSDLPEKSMEALALCMDGGGVVKYGRLKGYDDEMELFWERNRPASTIGILRMRGLLLVGKMVFGDRRYKVAYIPNEIRNELIPLLPSKTTTLDDY